MCTDWSIRCANTDGRMVQYYRIDINGRFVYTFVLMEVGNSNMAQGLVRACCQSVLMGAR